MALRDSYSLQSQYELSVVTQNESIQEFEQLGSAQEIDFEDYQHQEQSKVKLLQRFKAFLFQPLDLDPSDPSFVTAFCGGFR
jgi:hypothetical protein